MPCYDYTCKRCELTVEIFHTMSSKKKYKCPECNSKMIKLIGYGYFASSMKPSISDYKESEHKKKVKDPERAVRNRKREFGHDAVGDPSMITDPMHIIKKGRTLGGQQKDIDKKEIIKAAAKDDYVVDQCIQSVRNKKK